VSALRLGIAGCGRLAELGYVPALRGVAGLRLVALADPSADRRSTVADGARAVLGASPSTYASVEEMLRGQRLEALVIATPAEVHAGHAARASNVGVRALVEKPPAVDADGAAQLASLPGPPWIGFNRRFSGAAVLRPALTGAEEVELRLEIRYRRASWRPVSVADDALADLGPHLVDLSLWLCGAEPMEVTAQSLARERARLSLRTTGGRATIACASDRPHLERVEATAGGRAVTWRAGGPVAGIMTRLRRGEHPLVRSLRAQLKAYEAGLRGRPSEPLAPAADGEAVMSVIDAARASSAAGGNPVPVMRARTPGRTREDAAA
jgi:predicted dehydrogenase